MDLQPIDVADLTEPTRLAEVGLVEPTPGRRSWAGFQAIGEQLHNDGWPGLIAPSAARPASRILVVFLPDATLPPPSSPRPAELG